MCLGGFLCKLCETVIGSRGNSSECIRKENQRGAVLVVALVSGGLLVVEEPLNYRIVLGQWAIWVEMPSSCALSSQNMSSRGAVGISGTLYSIYPCQADLHFTVLMVTINVEDEAVAFQVLLCSGAFISHGCSRSTFYNSNSGF